MSVVQSKRLRDSARDEDCTVNIFSVCNHDPATVVLGHFPSEIAGYKPTDLSSGYVCSSCHDVIDRRVINEEFERERDWYLRRSQVRTMTRMHDKGLIKIAGAA